MSCMMVALLSLVEKSWHTNSKPRATNGSDPPTQRTRWLSMANMLATGLSRSGVEELSRLKVEPEWMLQKRLHAWEVYESTPLYIPKELEIEEPVLSRLWIDAPGSATFTHTLIIAEEQSSVRYVEEQNSSFDDERTSLL